MHLVSGLADIAPTIDKENVDLELFCVQVLVSRKIFLSFPGDFYNAKSSNEIQSTEKSVLRSQDSCDASQVCGGVLFLPAPTPSVVFPIKGRDFGFRWISVRSDDLIKDRNISTGTTKGLLLFMSFPLCLSIECSCEEVQNEQSKICTKICCSRCPLRACGKKCCQKTC